MIEIEDQIRVSCPMEDVWAVLADIPRWPDWVPTVQAARSIAGAGVGAQFALKQPLQKEAVWIVTEWEPGRSFTWVRTDPPRRFVARHKLVASETETISLVRLRVDGMGTAMSAVIRPVLAAAIASENRALRACCEALKKTGEPGPHLPERCTADCHWQYQDERKDHGTTH